jgi:FAD/FMN-containing dehydrogenase/Fe-S oxidoreductase
MNAARTLKESGASALEADLKQAVRGEVRFDTAMRAIYSTDSSNYRHVPIGVVVPMDVDDVVAAVEACRAHDVPILGRGGGTSLAGQCCNAGVVIDFSKFVHGFEIFPNGKRATVLPGTILDHLRDAANKHNLTFGPDPSTHDHCTLGGMIGNNSCGVHSVMSGRTAENVEQLDILLYDGSRMTVGPTSNADIERILRGGGREAEIYRGLLALRDRYADLIRARYPQIPRRISGYNLDELLPEKGFNVARALVGTESTCVMVLGADVRLVDWPPVRSLVVAGFEDAFLAADHVPEVLEHPVLGLEGIDEELVEDMKRKGKGWEDMQYLPEGKGWLLIEFGGFDRAESDEKAHTLMQKLKRARGFVDAKLLDNEEDEKHLWKVRESGLGATAFIPGRRDTWEGWEDSAVPPARCGDYLRMLRALMDRYGYIGALYGHYGDGCIHTRINFDLRTADGIASYRSFIDEAADLVVSFGGSLSGEHGDGQSRAALLGKMFGDELVRAFGEFKAIWDPAGKMNPGKVVDPYQPTDNLRIGVDFRPIQVQTHFAYREDSGDFAHAALRCVGVGKCRHTAGGVMCPSFMATRDEMHSTRGRARALFEMMRGEEITTGWRSEEVHEALDLCLSCKGCKNDCPVNVDMATYKSEFLSHYYKRRLRPRQAYALGLIYRWARIASKVPRLANWVTHAPIVSTVVKKVGGIAPQREAPVFAEQTLRDWFDARLRVASTGERVILWADTFNNFLHADAGRAAVAVLEAAGFAVELPSRVLCCGRPLYDYGMVDTAKRLLRQTLRVLRDEIAAGTPIIVIEPSCAAVFRDELPNLFPHDEDARRLTKQVFTLAEFLQDRDWTPPRINRRAIWFGHCHQRSVLDIKPDLELLKAMGITFEQPDSTCCGLAGSFGFEAGEKYDVSIKAGEGEHGILPKIREADLDTLIIADGFSCQTQIEHGTERKAMHLAQLIELGLRSGPLGPDVLPVERALANDSNHHRRARIPAGAAIGAALIAGGVLARRRSKRG